MKVRVIDEYFETNNCKTIVCDIIEPTRDDYRYLAGQYCVLEIEIDNINYKRCYSFSSNQTNNSNFHFTVKRVKDGIVSNYLIDEEQKGSNLNISKPFGLFNVHSFSKKSPIVFIAAGSGITPIYSMINSLIMDKGVDIKLIYFNKSDDETIYRDSLKKINREYENICVDMFNSTSDASDTKKGRLNNKLITESCPYISTSQVGICGPEGFIEKAESIVRMLGVAENNIHIERFSQAIDSIPLSEDANMVEVEFLCSGEKFTAKQGFTLLDISKKHGIEIRNECQVGSCGECKVKLEGGLVNCEHIGGLNPIDEANGFILSCCSTIESDVKIRRF
ncbi:iron-sulfur cluster-binding domain-containing protein [Vibrio kanaloae]|uniref:flavin reductase family protein n=1 Tax=Vibrio kanaloae TaxID=170673 RepID=UPI0010BE6C51|nr:iron-sulfur cluster-binding domain-containing protein [Vibrio kanaloae]TKF74160.1 iron-sulfur cluster-binding domain-containing protein [Vibrio kanaloae]